MNFEDLYKKKIEQQQFGNAERHWKQLEQRLDAAMPVAKKKRGFFWMFFAALTIASIATMMYQLRNSNDNSNAVAISISKDANIIEPQNRTTPASATNSASPSIAGANQSSNQSNIHSINSQENSKHQTSSSTNKNLLGNHLSSSNNTYSTPESTSQLAENNQQVNSTHSEMITATNMLADKSNTEEITNEKNSSSTSKLISELLSNNNNGLAAIDDSELLIANKNEERPNIDLASALMNITSPLNVSCNMKLVDTVVKSEVNNNESQKNTLDSVQVNKNADPSKDYAKKKSSNHFSVGVYGGSIFSMKHLYNFITSNSNHQIRNTNELSNAWSYQAGADVNYHIGKFIISTGINYHSQNQTRNIENAFYRDIETDSILTTINEKNYWSTSVDSFSTIQISSSWVSTPTSVNYYDGTTGGYTSNELASSTYVVDTQTVYHHLYDSVYVPSDTLYTNVKFSNIKKMRISSIKNLTGTNYIRYIEIPLMVGYSFQFNRLAIMVRSGIGFGIFSKQSNYFINSTETNLVASKNDDFRKLIYNYLLRVGVNYMITPKLGIAVEPIIRANLNSVFNNRNDFQQRFRNYGANFGITYKF